jgi:two-component system, NtrC family, sensor kinase
MKKTFILSTVLFAMILASSGFAQSKLTDSLKTVLAITTNPVERFNLLVKILENEDSYQVNKIDSSACAELLRIAQREKSDAMLATSFNWIGYYLAQNKGDNAAALEYYYKALPLAEKMNDKRRISSLCFDMAGVYAGLRNREEYLKYTLKGGRNLPDKSSPKYDYMLIQYQRNMANYFLAINKLDSAEYYGLAFSETSKRLQVTVFMLQAMDFNGNLNAKLGNNDKAEYFFKEELNIAKSLKSRRGVSGGSYIRFLIENTRFQEAAVLNQQFWSQASKSDNPNIELQAARLKRTLFETQNLTDSAYFYLTAETRIRDQIFNQNNQNIIQALAFKEQMRGIEEEGKKTAYQTQLKLYALLGGLGIFSIVALLLYRNNLSKRKANSLLQQQKNEVEVQKKNVEDALASLKSTQSQLVQSEKMASLGELTAGIAHEIQNPLNFVNNFSEVNKELLIELKDEIKKGNLAGVSALTDDVISNEEKINHHGKRADAIVKSMLQHSRTSSGKKELTDINALCDEYLRLAYHGLRAKEKSFNAKFETHLDPTLPKLNVIPQDIGRVILNLITNAFYAVNEKAKSNLAGYEPTVSVSTRIEGNKVLISVKDNGNGIPESIKDKIFQPFFTTKPTGQGTGLGLSLSYDIVKAHGGELKVETKEGEGSIFSIQLPSI